MDYAISLDIGGTKMEGALFDSRYRIVERNRVPAPRGTRKEALASIDIMIKGLRVRKIRGIGVSFPANILPGGRISRICKITGLKGFALQDYLSRKHNCRVVVANDADCFALGEHRLGAAKGTKNSVGLIWGTGVGAGIIIGHRPYRSSFGSAAEMGHNVIDPNGPPNPIGLKGDVESFSGGKSIAANYRRAGGKTRGASTERIFDLDESAAHKVIDDSYLKMALLCSHIQNTLDPDMIVVGGGISKRPIYPKLNSLTKKYTFPMFRNHVRIVKNRLGDSAGIYGAVALIFTEA